MCTASSTASITTNGIRRPIEHLAQPFDIDHLDQRLANKRALQARAGLPQRDDVPLVAMVTRLDWQKGLDITGEVLHRLLNGFAGEAQFVVLGTGAPEYEQMLAQITGYHREKSHAFLTYAADLAPLIYGGSDLFLMPSRFEPCGLGQMIAMRYGSVPVVRATGGLADTVQDGVTGFTFYQYSADDFWRAAGAGDLHLSERSHHLAAHSAATACKPIIPGPDRPAAINSCMSGPSRACAAINAFPYRLAITIWHAVPVHSQRRTTTWVLKIHSRQKSGRRLLKLPLKIGVTLMVVVPSGPIGLTKETMTLAKAPFALAQASNANALVSALAVELQAQAKAIVKAEESAFKHSDPMTYKKQAVEACQTAAAALSKASAEDAGAYRTWVLAVGQKVAEAAKDGGVLVSDQEKALLKELGAALRRKCLSDRSSLPRCQIDSGVFV